MDKTLTPLGIDVAKLTLDVRVFLPEPAVGPFKRFANGEQGLAQLQDWLLGQGYTRVHACLEATSTYSDLVAHFLSTQGTRSVWSTLHGWPPSVPVKAFAPRRIAMMPCS